MDKAEKFTRDDASSLPDEEDEETLAAIDEGIRDAGAGRVVPSEEVRRLMHQWITDSSTRKEH